MPHNTPLTEQEIYEQELADFNALGRYFSANGLQVPSSNIQPPELNPDGSLAGDANYKGGKRPTDNANPEGRNQYTNRGAAALTKKAHAASKAAHEFSGERSRRNHDAEESHRISGYALSSSDQKQMASARKYHQDAAETHARAGAYEHDHGYHEAGNLHDAAAAAHRKAHEYRQTLANNCAVHNDTKGWDEAKHPRGEGGRFGSGEGTTTESHGEDHGEETKEQGKEHGHGHSDAHALEHAGHMAHHAHEAHEVAEILAHGSQAAHDIHAVAAAASAAEAAHGGMEAAHAAAHAAAPHGGPEDVQAIVARHLYDPAVKAVTAAMSKIPGARTAGRAILACHRVANKAADHYVNGMIKRFGEGTTRAILGSGALLHAPVKGMVGIAGPLAHAIPAPHLIGSLPLAAIGYVGHKLGLVKPGGRLDKASAKVGSWVAAIATAVTAPFRAVKKAIGEGLAEAGKQFGEAIGGQTGLKKKDVEAVHQYAGTHNFWDEDLLDTYDYLVNQDITGAEELALWQAVINADGSIDIDAAAEELYNSVARAVWAEAERQKDNLNAVKQVTNLLEGWDVEMVTNANPEGHNQWTGKLKGLTTKDPKTMSAGQINKELDAHDDHSHKLTDEFIAAGRGYETPSEYLHPSKTDDLSRKAQALAARHSELTIERDMRTGGGMHRLPKGFGPRKL